MNNIVLGAILGSVLTFYVQRKLTSLRETHEVTLKMMDQFLKMRKEIDKTVGEIAKLAVLKALDPTNKDEIFKHRESVFHLFYTYYGLLPQQTLDDLLCLTFSLKRPEGFVYQLNNIGKIKRLNDYKKIEMAVKEFSLYRDEEINTVKNLKSNVKTTKYNAAIGFHARKVLFTFSQYSLSIEKLVKWTRDPKKSVLYEPNESSHSCRDRLKVWWEKRAKQIQGTWKCFQSLFFGTTGKGDASCTIKNFSNQTGLDTFMTFVETLRNKYCDRDFPTEDDLLKHINHVNNNNPLDTYLAYPRNQPIAAIIGRVNPDHFDLLWFAADPKSPVSHPGKELMERSGIFEKYTEIRLIAAVFGELKNITEEERTKKQKALVRYYQGLGFVRDEEHDECYESYSQKGELPIMQMIWKKNIGSGLEKKHREKRGQVLRCAVALNSGK